MGAKICRRFILLWLLAAAPAWAEGLRPFASDGCSDFPDGTPSQQDLWRHCCTAHDRSYWLGGTRAERLAADLELRRCVAGVGEPTVAALMLAGVRVGGTPWLPTRFRWGFGWPWPRGYRAVSAEELAEARWISEQRKPEQQEFEPRQ